MKYGWKEMPFLACANGRSFIPNVKVEPLGVFVPSKNEKNGVDFFPFMTNL
jgi:hypothetical protein